MKKAIVSVINDLATDRRVDKSCNALQKAGFDVLLVGRLLKDSLPLSNRPYKTHRMRLAFAKGPLFYAEYNIRLFFFLLFRKFDLLFSNDIDTTLPNLFARKLKGGKLILDCHEYFTETPELTNRKAVQNIWKKIERFTLPKVDELITVNDSIAKLFNERYGLHAQVIRNIPPSPGASRVKSRKELGWPEDKKIIILQGSGINIERGAEELTLAMKNTEGMLLFIIGGGDVFRKLQMIVDKNNLRDKVVLHPKVPFHELYQYSVNADLGVTIDKDTNINYHYSLPNKLFDYIQAGLPVLASRLPEIEKIISQYDIGTFIEKHDPEHIAEKLKEIFGQPEKLQSWNKNIMFAMQELRWETEEKQLISVIKQYA